MKSYLLVDIYNLFFRVMHTINPADKEDLQNGMMVHMMFTHLCNACTKFKPDHLVICSDGHKSWRKSWYNAYKANRIERLQERSPSDAMREERLKTIFEDDILPFLQNETNVVFLACNYAEADDLIARFVKTHPEDKHIIMSTDNDYVQLLADNVIIYNSMEERIISSKCVITADDKHTPLKFSLKQGKISVSKTDYEVKSPDELVPMKDWIEYALFTKCIRGDSSDNIMSAFPRVREKSTKKQVGVYDAFLDRNNKGYYWQSFMNSTWDNPLGEKKVVRECYEFNKRLIDLDMIPEELRERFDKAIDEALNKPAVEQVGIRLMKYFKRWDLNRLKDTVQAFSKYFSNSCQND